MLEMVDGKEDSTLAAGKQQGGEQQENRVKILVAEDDVVSQMVLEDLFKKKRLGNYPK